MKKQTQTMRQQRQSPNTDFFVWLARNMVPIAVVLVLLVGGMIIVLIQDGTWRKDTSKTADSKWTDKDWQAARYGQEDCDKEADCRQLKRIYAEGGASQEAIRKNLLAADKTVTFEKLQEEAARYEGTPWAFEGKIVDIIGQEKRGIGDYILAEVIIGEDQAKRVSVRGDFATDLAENDYVYVVGYLTGTSHPGLGKYQGRVPSLSARALLRPGEVSALLGRTATN